MVNECVSEKPSFDIYKHFIGAPQVVKTESDARRELDELDENPMPVEADVRAQLVERVVSGDYPMIKSNLLSNSTKRATRKGGDHVFISVPQFGLFPISSPLMAIRFGYEGGFMSPDAFLFNVATPKGDLPYEIVQNLARATPLFKEGDRSYAQTSGEICRIVGSGHGLSDADITLLRRFKEWKNFEFHARLAFSVPKAAKETIMSAEKVFGNEVYFMARINSYDWMENLKGNDQPRPAKPLDNKVFLTGVSHRGNMHYIGEFKPTSYAWQ